MYVYAFPEQRAAIALAGPMSLAMNIAVAFPITLLSEVLSWTWVEKPPARPPARARRAARLQVARRAGGAGGAARGDRAEPHDGRIVKGSVSFGNSRR